MTKLPQLALALLGTAITVVVIQYARDVDRLVAPRPAEAFGVQASDGRTSKAARRVGGEPEVVTPERGGAIPVTTAPARAVTADANEIETEEATDASDTEPSRLFGIRLPDWVDNLLGRRRSSVAGGTSIGSTETPPSATTAVTPSGGPAGATGCKHAIAPHPHGVSAEVDFVGVLLNGQQRESESFSGAELDDLKILVEWKSLFQNHAQRLDLIAPDGSLYQSLSRPLTIDSTAAPVETRVAVNGTWITRYGLYGSWCVEVFLDEEDAPIASSRLVIARPQ